MTDDFESALAQALKPEEREPDRQFVLRVQTAILLEERLTAERRALGASLAKQLLGLVAVAAAIVVVSRSAAVEDWFQRSPGIGLAALIVGFGLVAILVGGRPVVREQRFT
ncbi:MAG TPA: hypothetical protein VNR68_00895 [Sphingomicrobium sp.]|nr:hypothetical protein [Sphingomicrobium sp.]